MATFNEQLMQIVEDYRAEGNPWPATREQIAEWAVANAKHQLTRGMAVRQCAEAVAKAMKLEHVKDHRGRSVRQYYAARIRENGQQVIRWDDWNAERPFMEISTANRRNQILGGCRQLKDDIDSYNERICPGNPIQVEFDFRTDLEELDQLRDAAD
jgi:hypothetical protein